MVGPRTHTLSHSHPHSLILTLFPLCSFTLVHTTHSLNHLLTLTCSLTHALYHYQGGCLRNTMGWEGFGIRWRKCFTLNGVEGSYCRMRSLIVCPMISSSMASYGMHPPPPNRTCAILELSNLFLETPKGLAEANTGTCQTWASNNSPPTSIGQTSSMSCSMLQHPRLPSATDIQPFVSIALWIHIFPYIATSSSKGPIWKYTRVNMYN